MLWLVIVTVASGAAEMPQPRGNGAQDAHFLLGGRSRFTSHRSGIGHPQNAPSDAVRRHSGPKEPSDP
jgi:hypothetical protein